MPALLGLLLLASASPYRWKSIPANVWGMQSLPFDPTTDVAAGALAPEIAAWVGQAPEGIGLRYTLDGGKHWHAPASLPPKRTESLPAVSADGKTWAWGGFQTDDLGATWTESRRLPEGLRVVADGTSADRFYAMDLAGNRLYQSRDGGKRFDAGELALPDGARERATFYATPGRAGDFWVAASDGLFHAPPVGVFVRLPRVTEAQALGFGRAAPGRSGRAIYLAGVVDGARGIFRSDDDAATWLRIDDGSQGTAIALAGDLKKFGRVVVRTQDGAAFVGELR